MSAPPVGLHGAVDTTAPASPTGLALDASTDSGTLGDSLTNTGQIVIDDTAEANGTVTLFEGTTVVGNGVTDSLGAFHITTTALADGAHALTAKATDAAGNISTASSAYTVTVDTTSSSVPALTFTGFAASGGPATVLSGTGDAGRVVTLYDGTTMLATTSADQTGAFSFTSLAALSSGKHVLSARSATAAGTVGAASLSLTIDVDTAANVAGQLTACRLIRRWRRST